MSFQDYDPQELASSMLRFDGPLVRLTFGPNSEILNVHRAHLERMADFFKTALRSDNWTEGRINEINLPEDEADTVQAYLHFFYTGKIVYRSDDRDKITMDLAKLYVFGEKYQDSNLKDRTIDALLSYLHRNERRFQISPMTTETVDFIYEGTMRGSTARRFLTDWHVYKGGQAALRDECYHEEFQADMAQQSSFLSFDTLRSFPLQVCLYHEHSDDVRCPARNQTIGNMIDRPHSPTRAERQLRRRNAFGFMN